MADNKVYFVDPNKFDVKNIPEVDWSKWSQRFGEMGWGRLPGADFFPIPKVKAKRMPRQKPGKSEQTVCTPDNFLEAAKKRLGIEQFTWDLAATKENSVCGPDYCYTEEDNSLVQPWNLTRHTMEKEPDEKGGELTRWVVEKQWNWCNPPFTKIEDWVNKARNEALYGACTAMLVPASVGANWWNTFVDGYAYVTFLNGRLTFKGHDKPYPKDMALLLYAPYLNGGSCVWRWK